jgi:1,4-alpha-glucan branching enzyme
MKHSNRHEQTRSAGPRLESVRFEFTDPTANTVGIAGTFNDWHPEAKPMHAMGGGRWLKETVLAPGTYEYLLVVDGHWLPDPLAHESVPNPFGGRNSVLRVANSPGALAPGGGQTNPLQQRPPGERADRYEETHSSHH